MAKAKASRKLSAYNRFMARELKGKMRGKTKAQRQAIFKAAVAKWKRHKGGRASRPRSRPQTSSRGRPKAKPKINRGGGSVAKRGFLSFRTIKRLVQIGALAAPAVGIAMEQTSGEEKVRKGLAWYTGFNIGDGTFDWGKLTRGWMPYIATVLVTEGVAKLASMIRKLF